MTRTLKNALCIAILLALALAIISSAAPAFAGTWSLSAEPSRTTYVQGELVTINGTLTDTATGAPGANFLVGVTVYDSANKPVYSTLVGTGTAGTYSTQFSISSTGPTGTYTIEADAVEAANGQEVATAEATFSVGIGPTPAASPTPTATPTPLSSTSPTPETPEFPSAIIVAILLIAMATAILFYKRQKTDEVNNQVPTANSPHGCS